MAMLGTDPEVERLRIVIGTEFVNRFREAIGEPADPRVLETLTWRSPARCSRPAWGC